ncbi:hypothetical protein SKAU_G00227080 [Synaphobranchus kaupii]|uniref:Uncharacterized protein n=1 Tax=Synaphobranchus kaupii TaxID=118154 RepID=A0A9Q1F4V8_SYNKA|nr:hypothetical protein SKAU_G00227080 [Synaphobranchus kaupii]
MHKHHHCCKCPECYEVTRMAALRRMDTQSYGDWQPDPYGYPAGYSGGQAMPPPTPGGGGGRWGRRRRGWRRRRRGRRRRHPREK